MGCINTKQHNDEVKILSLDNLKEATYEMAEDPTYEFSDAKVIKVYDGDTVTIAVIENNKIVKYNVRLYGVDCEELKGGTDETKCKARLAKVYMENLLLDKMVKIYVMNGRDIAGEKIKEKYGRLLSEIYINGENVSDLLLSTGLAKKYYGGAKNTY